MRYILHKLWESWYIPYYRYCRVYIINRNHQCYVGGFLLEIVVSPILMIRGPTLLQFPFEGTCSWKDQLGNTSLCCSLVTSKSRVRWLPKPLYQDCKEAYPKPYSNGEGHRMPGETRRTAHETRLCQVMADCIAQTLGSHPVWLPLKP